MTNDGVLLLIPCLYVIVTRNQKRVLEAKGLNVTAKMVAGLPHIEIHRVADNGNCSLIAIGSHGYSTAGEHLPGGILGGVAGAVVQSATPPVLIPRLKPTEQGGRPRC